jgi:hypothetical protein
MIPLNNGKNLHEGKLEGNDGSGKKTDGKINFVFLQKG